MERITEQSREEKKGRKTETRKKPERNEDVQVRLKRAEQ